MRRRNPSLFRTKPRTIAQIRRSLTPKRTSGKKKTGVFKKEAKAFGKGFAKAGAFMLFGPSRKRRR